MSNSIHCLLSDLRPSVPTPVKVTILPSSLAMTSDPVEGTPVQHVITVVLVDTTSHGTPPTSTVTSSVVSANPRPVMVSRVPPVVLPLLGVTLCTSIERERQ